MSGSPPQPPRLIDRVTDLETQAVETDKRLTALETHAQDTDKRLAVLEGAKPPIEPPIIEPPPTTTESPEGTEVTATSTNRRIVDAAGNVFTLVNGVVQINGTPDGTTDNVVRERYVSHQLWQQVIKPAYPAPDGHWWSLNGATAGSWTDQGTGLPPGAQPMPPSTTQPPIQPPPGGQTIITAPAAQANIIVHLDQLQRVIPAGAWGIASGADAHDNWSELMTQPRLMLNTLSQGKLGCFRLHAGERVDEAFAQGNTGIMDNFFNTIAPAILIPNARLIIGVSWIDGNNTPAKAASNAVAFLRGMKAKGHPIMDIEIGNEYGGDPGTYVSYATTVADAVHSQVDPAIKIWVPISAWWGALDVGRVANGMGARGPSCGFCFHAYPCDPAEGTDKWYSKADQMEDCIDARKALAPTPMANSEMGIGEWAMNGAENPGGWGIPPDGRFEGAVFAALYVPRALSTDGKLTWLAPWDLYSDSRFGFTANSEMGNDPTKLTPRGWYFGKAAQIMPGTQVGVECKLPTVRVLATLNGKRLSLHVVNRDLSAAVNAKIAVVGGSFAPGAVARWEIGQQNPNTPGTSTTTDISNFPVAAQQVVMAAGVVV